MERKKNQKGLSIALGIGTFFFLMMIFILPNHMTNGWLAGYGLGVVTILLHFIASKAFKRLSERNYFRVYFLGIAIRFVLVIALFIWIIIYGKIDQISFTVSFIISYIFHSVIEIILINKKLTNRTG